MIKKILLSLLAILCVAPVFGQKIKHKKGEILIDKVLTFKFERTSGKGESLAYAMTSLDGDTLLKLANHQLDYVQLPYELSARLGLKYCEAESPVLERKKTPIYHIGLSAGNRFVYAAKKMGILTPLGLEDSKWEEYLTFSGSEDIAEEFTVFEANNKIRVENSQNSIEQFGDFKPRKKGDVSLRDGKVVVSTVTIGKIEKAVDKRKENRVFDIKTKDGKYLIAIIYYKPESLTYTVKTMLDMKKTEFKILTSLSARVEPLQDGLNFLVNLGYL